MRFLTGKNLYLRPLLANDVTEDYISWLNDPETSKYSMRRFLPNNEFQARKYLSTRASNDVILAICTKDGKHIGNIKFGPIDWINKTAEVSILLGDRSQWGKGYSREAIYLVTKHLFLTVGLNRIFAGTINPAFTACVRKLGWKEEGLFRKGFFFDGKFLDIVRLSILKEEFREMPEFEEQ